MSAAPSPGSSLAHTLGRHQVASLASTVVDFGTMILVVQLTSITAEAATFVGASFGAVANFTLSRLWVFPLPPDAGEDRKTALRREAIRYAIVSAASAGWNSAGEGLFHRVLGLQYVLARGVTAILVSLLWNFPLQRKFVFPRGSDASTKPQQASTYPAP